MESKKAKLLETESKMIVTRAERLGFGMKVKVKVTQLSDSRPEY